MKCCFRNKMIVVFCRYCARSTTLWKRQVLWTRPNQEAVLERLSSEFNSAACKARYQHNTAGSHVPHHHHPSHAFGVLMFHSASHFLYLCLSLDNSEDCFGQVLIQTFHRSSMAVLQLICWKYSSFNYSCVHPLFAFKFDYFGDSLLDKVFMPPLDKRK